MPRADREAIALIRRLGLDEPPISVNFAAERLGATVVREDFSNDDVSGVLIRDDGDTVIGVNKHHARTRQRFTIAHELGHLLLHAGKPVILDKARVNFRDATSAMASDRDEIQANAFAAELLMPRELVVQHARIIADQYPDAHEDVLVGKLAELFDVSTDAMNFRLINLGIIWR